MNTAALKGPRPYHVGRAPAHGLNYSTGARSFVERFKAIGPIINWRPTEWTEPRYPGDSILLVDLVRGDEFGDIRVQWGFKDDRLKVCSFTPGYEECPPGDTPKTWPDRDEYVSDKAAASKVVMQFLIAAIREGWRIKQ